MGAVVVLAVALAGCSQSSSSEAAATEAGKGYISGPGVVDRVPAERRRPLPEVSGRLLDGGQFRSSEHAGKVLVFNVWGSWCPPCRAEAPALQEVWQETRGRGVQFVGINVKDNDASARGFERTFGLTYPSIVDDTGEVTLAFRSALPPNAIPSTVLVDRRGRVAARILGATTYTKLRALVEEVLEEPS